MTDTFGYLLANLNAREVRGIRYCDGQIVGPKLHLSDHRPCRRGPAQSRISAGCCCSANLAGKDGKAGAAPTMTDDLIFTTTVTLQGTPKVVFAPVGTLLRVADASLDRNVGRSDKHQVTIGLAVDVGTAFDSLRGFLFSAGRGSAGGAVIANQRTVGRQRDRRPVCRATRDGWRHPVRGSRRHRDRSAEEQGIQAADPATEKGEYRWPKLKARRHRFQAQVKADLQRQKIVGDKRTSGATARSASAGREDGIMGTCDVIRTCTIWVSTAIVRRKRS